MSTKISCIAIDDEPFALELIGNYVSKTDFLDFRGKFLGVKPAIELLIKEQIDLIFLDIQMPDITGIEFTKAYNLGTKVVFTTAYEKYALEGFKLEVSDYLLKPFSYEEFLKSATKVKDLLELKRKPEKEDIVTENGYLFVKTDYQIVKVSFDEILFVEGFKDYVKIYLSNTDKPILSLLSLKALEEKLPPDNFMRVHRSFIIALNKIPVISRNNIVFGKTYIPISRQYKEKFDEFLKKKIV